MAYRKKTLRRLPEKTRKLARLIGELTSTTTRLKNYLPEVEQLELDSKALTHAKQINKPDLIAAAGDMAEALKDIIEQAERTRLPLGADLADSINVFGKQALAKWEAGKEQNPFPPDQPEG